MLQLQAKSIDICRISKLLARYDVKASISNSVITLSNDVSDELLTQLCGSIKIDAVQNFISEEPLFFSTETTSAKSAECIQTEVVEKPIEAETTLVEGTPKVDTTQLSPTLSHYIPAYDLIYSKVKRGEIYLCDFGKPYGSEQGKMRPAIIIQNNIGNLYSPTTIVVACTSKNKKNLPTHYNTCFSTKNMVDFSTSQISMKENVIMAEHIKTVDKTRLRKYLGTLKPDFMKILDSKINISLHLNEESQTVVKEKIYVDEPKTSTEVETPKERKDVNMIQVQLLSFVDIKELIRISQSISNDEVKAQRILELFGFDFKRNGVQYLLKAIIASPKNAYFNLETLSEAVSQTEGIDKEEIKRLIVARVKETFGFRKAPTIDFIRLINIFL